jgi:COP9 signalosome complex subunit 2
VKTNLKLGKLWLDRGEYGRLGEVGGFESYDVELIASHKVLKQLYASTSTQSGDGTSEQDQSRSTQLLEIYALEIQMYNATKNYKKLKVGLSSSVSIWMLTPFL